MVTIDELVAMVSMALDSTSVSACTAGDANGDDAITVDEIIVGIGYALDGCRVAPTFTPTRTPSPTPIPVGAVGGTIRYYHSKTPVAGIPVALTGSTILHAETDTSGGYVVHGVSLVGDWSVEPSQLDEIGSAMGIADQAAVNSLDADLALQAANGERTLTPDQRLACDVDGDGAVTSTDATLIRQHGTSSSNRFPVADQCGSDCLFVPVPAVVANQCLLSPRIDTGTCQPGSINMAPLSGSAMQQDFDAILFGDCDGSWTPPGGPAAPADGRTDSR